MIAPELQLLLDPLERFEAQRRTVARLGDRLADLSYANPYEGAHRDVREALLQTLSEERSLDLQYTPFGGAALSRRAIADSLRERHRLPVSFRDVVLTPGAMSALQLALRVCGCVGDEVLIPTPCWLDYPLYARFVGLSPRLVLPPNSIGEIDLPALRAAAGERTCALLMSSPSNPTGRRYDAAALVRLGEALRGIEEEMGCELTVIADETHSDFVRPGEHHPLAGFFGRTITVYSFGKYHYAQGQRLGYAAVSPLHPRREQVSEEMIRWSRITGIATPTALMQRALPRLLALTHDIAPLESSRELVVDRLTRAGYEMVVPNATAFVYVQTPGGYMDDFAFTAELAKRGVLVLAAPIFHHQGYFRLALTGSEWMLERALSVLEDLAPR
jgi:aspartate aminotransferase